MLSANRCRVPFVAAVLAAALFGAACSPGAGNSQSFTAMAPESLSISGPAAWGKPSAKSAIIVGTGLSARRELAEWAWGSGNNLVTAYSEAPPGVYWTASQPGTADLAAMAGKVPGASAESIRQADKIYVPTRHGIVDALPFATAAQACAVYMFLWDLTDGGSRKMIHGVYCRADASNPMGKAELGDLLGDLRLPN